MIEILGSKVYFLWNPTATRTRKALAVLAVACAAVSIVHFWSWFSAVFFAALGYFAYWAVLQPEKEKRT